MSNNVGIKACIMAGGKGTRLKPLTDNLPKPLAPVLGKPVIYYILELLEKHNVDSAVLSLGYQGQKLKSELVQNYSGKLKLDYAFEETPLGTAGGVRNAIENADDDFIVISGDAICDFDLTKAIEFHKRNKSVATIIGYRVSDPREYGLINCDENGRIESFTEKPSYLNCCSDIASTGIYILSEKILPLVERGENMDFAKDIFPKLIESNQPMYMYEDSGYWCDIGDIKSYIECQRDLLNGKSSCKIDAKCINGVYYKSGEMIEGADVIAPAFIGEGVTLAKGSVVCANSVICDNVTISTGSVIKGSVLLDSVFAGEYSSINGAVCCNSAQLERNVSLNEGCIIGASAVIGDGATIAGGVKVWSDKNVLAGVTLREDLQFGCAKDIIIEEEGISGYTNVALTPELCVKIGSSVASLKIGASVGIAYSCHKSSPALYYAAVSGAIAAGANVRIFGECIETEFKFCMCKSLVDYGIYIDGGTISTIKICEKGAMPTSRTVERKLESAVNRGEFKRASINDMGQFVDMQNLKELYQIELLKLCDAPLDGLKISVKGYDKSTKLIMEQTLQKLGCETNSKDDERLTLSIKPGGTSVSISDNDGNYIFSERILVLVCLSEFLKGESVAVENTAPRILDELAEKYGQSVSRYSSCPCDDNELSARQKAAAKPFLRDGLMLATKLLSFMKDKKLEFKELLKYVPDFNISTRLVSIATSPSLVMKELKCQKKIGIEGAYATINGQSALLRPVKSGKGIMIFSESLKSETAIEICDIFEGIIKDAILDSK